jgi:hypothetical protein
VLLPPLSSRYAGRRPAQSPLEAPPHSGKLPPKSPFLFIGKLGRAALQESGDYSWQDALGQNEEPRITRMARIGKMPSIIRGIREIRG